MAAQPEQRSLDFEVFLAQTLLPDLQRAEAAREVFAGELRAYEELRDLVLKLQKARSRPLSPHRLPSCWPIPVSMHAWRAAPIPKQGRPYSLQKFCEQR